MLESAGYSRDATGELGRVVGVISCAAIVALTGPEKQALQVS